MLAGTSLAEESVECIIATANSFVTWHLAIWLNAVLKAEELPASIANLHTTLAEMKAKDLTHICKEDKRGRRKSSSRALEMQSCRVCRVM